MGETGFLAQVHTRYHLLMNTFPFLELYISQDEWMSSLSLFSDLLLLLKCSDDRTISSYKFLKVKAILCENCGKQNLTIQPLYYSQTSIDDNKISFESFLVTLHKSNPKFYGNYDICSCSPVKKNFCPL